MIWTTNQIRRVFGWRDILQNWHNTLVPCSYIKTVMENLRAATSSTYGNNFPLTHFLTFLNYEQEGIKWLIYEVISSQWLHGRVRVDYLQGLVDQVDNLDSGFPAFVGSPMNNITIRSFVNESLTTYDLGHINMMPPLVPLSFGQARAQPAQPQASPARKTVYPVLQFRLYRDGNKGKDDVINISKVSHDSYNITYNDQESKHRNKTTNMSRNEVINYMKCTLRMLQLDEYPFQKIQVVLPNMPSVAISPDNLFSQTRDLIYDSIEAVMDNWPVSIPAL